MLTDIREPKIVEKPWRTMAFLEDMKRALLEGRKTMTRVANPLGVPPEMCGFGGIGGKLWVRETYHVYPDKRIIYALDFPPNQRPPVRWTSWLAAEPCSRRIVLTIKDIREEYLQSVTDADIIAEGIDPAAFPTEDERLAAFIRLWNSCYPTAPSLRWSGNPRVVAYTFDVEITQHVTYNEKY